MSDELTIPSVPTPQEEEQVLTPRRKRPILLGLVLAVLVVIIGGGIVLYLRGDIRLPGAPTALPKVMEKIKNGQSKCDGAKDAEKCLSELTLDEAVAGKQAEACEKIKKVDLRDGCYSAIAGEMSDEKICQGIHRIKARDECVGAVIFTRAIKGTDTALCATIVSESWKDGCFNRIFELRGALDYCDTVGERKTRCVEIVSYRDAIRVGNPKLCSKIEDKETMLDCEEVAIGSAALMDSDNDGLTNEQEAQLGTDPRNPDTDGDGFKDGDEVKAGYNPKGAGRIP